MWRHALKGVGGELENKTPTRNAGPATAARLRHQDPAIILRPPAKSIFCSERFLNDCKQIACDSECPIGFRAGLYLFWDS
jgi:hypothetical protein